MVGQDQPAEVRLALARQSKFGFVGSLKIRRVQTREPDVQAVPFIVLDLKRVAVEDLHNLAGYTGADLLFESFPDAERVNQIDERKKHGPVLIEQHADGAGHQPADHENKFVKSAKHLTRVNRPERTSEAGPGRPLADPLLSIVGPVPTRRYRRRPSLQLEVRLKNGSPRKKVRRRRPPPVERPLLLQSPQRFRTAGFAGRA